MTIRLGSLLILLIVLATSMIGCLEASFELAPESRLPKWFEVPEGMSRNEINVTMDYYIGLNGREAVFKLYGKGSSIYLQKAIGSQRGDHPLKLMKPPPGFPKHYPGYEVITVNGITDIIEHRKMEPIFYVTDDPSIWKEFGVEDRSQQSNLGDGKK
jgi:hypothetical protein